MLRLILISLLFSACGGIDQVNFPGTNHPETVKKMLCDGKIQNVMLPDECK